MGGLNGWWLGLIAALLAGVAAAGLEMRAGALEDRLATIESTSERTPATATAVPPPAAEPAPPTAPPPPEAVPPEVRTLEEQVDALEIQADEAGLPDPDPEARARRSGAVRPTPAAGAAGPSAVLDPRIRAAARERAERELAKERASLAEKEREKSELRRQEMLQQFDMMKKMFGPERASKMTDKLMKALGIPEEHRAKVENALRAMATTLGNAIEAGKTRIQSMPEVTEESMQTIFATQLGMAYMTAMTDAAKVIKQVVPTDKRGDIGEAIQQAMQPDEAEMREMSGAGESAGADSASEPPPEPPADAESETQR